MAVAVLTMKTRAAWRRWLASHHAQAEPVWLVFFKAHVDEPGVSYDASVEEALCYGWIDSMSKRIDDDRYMRKFSPRKPKSKWSASNKKRVAKLEAAGKLAAPGQKLIDAARQDGSWDDVPDAEKTFEVPSELTAVLAKSRKAKAAFEGLPSSHRREYILWVASARKPETRARRADKARTMLEAGDKVGLR